MNHVYPLRSASVLSCLLSLLTITASANIYTVTNTGDNGGVNPAVGAGTGTLRQAIIDANANPGADIINFNISGTGPFTIAPTIPLPDITDAVTIDGYSQPGSAQGSISGRTILINLNGASAGTNAIGLFVDANNVTVDGLAIYSFSSDGIFVFPGRNNFTLWGAYIGTDNTGTTNFGNVGHGVNFNDYSPGIAGGTAVNTMGAVIGTNGDGNNDANEGNLISGNGTGTTKYDGIAGWQLINSIIAGNIIGLNKNGTGTGLGNGRNGIILTVSSTGNRIGTNGDGLSDAVEGNIVSRNGTLNTDVGILIAANSDNNVVAGNTVGLDASNAAAGNTGVGVELVNSNGVRVGILATDANFAAERNTISANGSDGVLIISQNYFGFNGNANANTIAGNYIGTTSSNTSVGNAGNGIHLLANNAPYTVNDNIIGSNGDGTGDDQEGNTIAYNTLNGMSTNASTLIANNRISRNAIYSNTGLGIDLGDDGVTPNDDGDVDAGANSLYNFPVITGVVINTTTNNMTVTGFARPGAWIEFYIADGGSNPSNPPGTKNFGEGQTYLFTAQEGASTGIVDADNTTGTYTGADEGTNTGGTRTENKFRFVVPLSSLAATITGTPPITALNYSAQSGAGSTSEFAGNLAVVLTPVTYSSLSARLDKGKVYVQWKTSSEENNRRFEVERSPDGRTFIKLGELNGQGGINRSYEFIDNNPLPTVGYYRLKQIDVDNKFAYSRVLVVRADLGKLEVKIAPNPVVSNLNVSFNLEKSELIRVNIYDQMGRLARRYSFQGNSGINIFNLTGLDNLPAGNYAIEVAGETLSARQQILKK